MTTDSETKSMEFEDRFTRILNDVEAMVGRSNLALQDTLLPSVDRYSMPDIPVWRIHLSATSTFLGIIQCLRTRPASLSALSLLRGLIEAWTHLYFIADDSEPGTASLRAIRFEAGVLHEWASVKKKMDPTLDYEEVTRQNDIGIMKLWTANGGENQPKRRTHKDVTPTLKIIAKSPPLAQLGTIHASSSIAVHMSAADFLLESTDFGVSVTWASEARRCAWLQLAIMCFDNLTMCALSSTSSDDNDAVIRDLHTQWQAIYNNELLLSTVASENAAESRVHQR